MVTPAMRTTAVLIVFYAIFSFAMTSGLASDSDKFKIIIKLHRALKFEDTGSYKNFDFLFYRLTAAIFLRNVFYHVPKWELPPDYG